MEDFLVQSYMRKLNRIYLQAENDQFGENPVNQISNDYI